MNSIPDLNYYIKLANSVGISEKDVKNELLDLINETKSYIGAVKILVKKIKNHQLEVTQGDTFEKEKENKFNTPTIYKNRKI